MTDGHLTASLKYNEAGLFAEHPTDAERIARLADDFAQVWAAKAAEARAAVETPDHLGDLGIVNVRVYGAVGDGKTDDTAAIQAAIDAAGVFAGTVFLPVGLYRITATLTIPLNPSIRMVGGGAKAALEQESPAWSSTLATGTSGMTMVQIGTGTALYHQGPIFENITFDNYAGGNATLVNVDAVNRCTFRDCTFRGSTTVRSEAATDHGLVMGFDYDTYPNGDCAWHTIENCSFLGLGGDSLNCYGSLVLVGGEFTCAAGGYAMRLRGGNYRVLGPKVDNGLMVFNTQASTFIVHSEYHIENHDPIVTIGTALSDHDGWPCGANTFRGSVRASGDLAFALGEHAHNNEITAFVDNADSPSYSEHESATGNTLTLYNQVAGYPQ